MKVNCPNCGLEQQTEDVFCTRCGAKLLEESGGVPTMVIGSGTIPIPNHEFKSVTAPGNARLNLHLIRTGEILPVGGVGEYIVGRVSSGQSVVPDIDLESFHAYEDGVSRLHARIRVEEKAIWITDLGSANGTRVNDEKLKPHKDHPINDKDIIRLGRFSFQALIGPG